MNDKKAFSDWIDTQILAPGWYEIWNAACAWQREQDAKLCDTAHPNDWAFLSGKIREQE